MSRLFEKPIIYNFNKVYGLLDAKREYTKHESQVYRYFETQSLSLWYLYFWLWVFCLVPVYFRSVSPNNSPNRHVFRKYIHHGVIGLPCCSYFKARSFISFRTILIITISCGLYLILLVLESPWKTCVHLDSMKRQMVKSLRRHGCNSTPKLELYNITYIKKSYCCSFQPLNTFKSVRHRFTVWMTYILTVNFFAVSKSLGPRLWYKVASVKRLFCIRSVPHEALQTSPDSENLFYYHDEMNRESPTVITSGHKDLSVIPTSVSNIRIYGNSENYFWCWFQC